MYAGGKNKRGIVMGGDGRMDTEKKTSHTNMMFYKRLNTSLERNGGL